MSKKWIAVLGIGVMVMLPQWALAKIWTPADGEQIVYSVLSKEKKIGEMSVSFARPDAETLIVTRQQSVKARKFMMTVSMDQVLVETWHGDQLHKMIADIDVKTPVQDMVIDADYQRQDDGVLLFKNEDSQYPVEQGLWPSTLWHGKFLKQRRFFQPPNGLPVDIEFKHVGKDDMNGCHRFEATSNPQEGEAGTFTLWFAGNGKPCRMEFTSAVGVLTYVVQ